MCVCECVFDQLRWRRPHRLCSDMFNRCSSSSLSCSRYMLEVLIALIILQEFWLHFSNLRLSCMSDDFLLPSSYDLMLSSLLGQVQVESQGFTGKVQVEYTGNNQSKWISYWRLASRNGPSGVLRWRLWYNHQCYNRRLFETDFPGFFCPVNTWNSPNLPC